MLFLVATAVTTLCALQATDPSVPGVEASISGIVSDAETGAPVRGAVVALSGTMLTSLSQPDGSYVLHDVPQGSRALVVARSLYHPRSFRAIVPASGAIRIDVALHPAPTTLPPIEVKASLPAAEGDAGADWSMRRVSAADVRNDPRLAEEDALQALAGSGVTLRPESPEGLHILGGTSDQVAYSIDGVPVFSPYHGAGTFGAWNPDALAHLDVRAGPASSVDPDGLSGAVAATTLTPAPRHEVRGSVSSSQVRSTFDGPIGVARAGYLISLRSTFPGLLAHSQDGSYLGGEGSDWLAKVESPFAGGRARILGYGSDNEVSTARNVLSRSARNEFAWRGQSFGIDWSRQVSAADLRVSLWSAASDAGATWPRDSTSVDRLASRRRDLGLHITADLGTTGRRTSLGVRARRSATLYHIGPDTADSPTSEVDQTILLWAGSITHERAISPRSALVLSLGAEAAGRVFRVDPGVEARWRPTDRVLVSVGVSRRHQFAQSLRNEESVVGAIFPADLFVAAGRGGVPVARSDLGVVMLEYRPEAGTRLTGRAYLRNLGGVVIVAPLSSAPFAGAEPSAFLAGSGTSAGIALEAAAAGPAYGLTVTYGLQRTRLAFGDSSYTPAFGIAHSLEAGALLMASPGTSFKIGVTALFGRHGTAVTGPFEWESCNLLDNGCEFAGTPRAATQELGLLDLPPYLRLDLGLRHRWVLTVGGRQSELGLFGTLTNILDRQNVLTETIDPLTGSRGKVDMRPRSPLTIGLDWRY